MSKGDTNTKPQKPREPKVTVTGVLSKLFTFVTVFAVTFIGLWYFNKYKKIVHCHISSPLEEEMHLWPEYKKFFYKYRNRFNIVYRNVSKLLFGFYFFRWKSTRAFFG